MPLPGPTGALAADDTTGSLTRVLAAMAGPGAAARDGQQEAVDALVVDRRRVLVVQATGWGKSAVYWAATLARRQLGAGPTVVVSPLLALMRDQVAAAARVGLRAVTVNSANVEDWDDVFAALGRDEVDVLLVSPERLSNPAFAERALPLLRRTGLLVVDEAHCISDWGFDFRPDYQRVARLLLHLDQATPVLATTATANARVTDDVAAQLGDGTLVLRGPLARRSLQLAVVPGLSSVERFAWVADALDSVPGSGIVYALTVDAVTSLAAFLAGEGHAVAAYTGSTPPAEREAVEAALRANELKAVVATSALGMGYDKPDLAFCIHVGSPDSPVAYYQQVGRAGRALESAAGVLLPAAESDPRIWEYFATATIPDPQAAEAVLGLLDGGGPLTLPALEAETGVRRGRLEALLKVLRVDGAVDRVGNGWAGTGRGWTYDAQRYAAVVRARRAEADLMREYAAGRRCLMQVLVQALDDPLAEPCGSCSVCTGTLPQPGARPTPARVVRAAAALRGRDHVLEPRKQWPSGGSRRGRIAGCEPGRAVAFADDPAWADLVAEVAGPDDGPSTDLRDGLVEVLRRWAPQWAARPVAVVPVPSRAHPRRVTGMAEHVADVGRLPLLDLLRVRDAPVPPELASGARVAALTERLALVDGARVPDGPLLLVDDVAASRWTLTVAAALLREAGATAVLPLVAHQRP